MIGGYECAVDVAALADGNARDIWDWYFELAEQMQDQTTNGSNSWPANQMNITHYLDGTRVPTQAPPTGFQNLTASGLTNTPPPGSNPGINPGGSNPTTQAMPQTTPAATQPPGTTEAAIPPIILPGTSNPGDPGTGDNGLASMQERALFVFYYYIV